MRFGIVNGGQLVGVEQRFEVALSAIIPIIVVILVPVGIVKERMSILAPDTGSPEVKFDLRFNTVPREVSSFSLLVVLPPKDLFHVGDFAEIRIAVKRIEVVVCFHESIGQPINIGIAEVASNSNCGRCEEFILNVIALDNIDFVKDLKYTFNIFAFEILLE